MDSKEVLETFGISKNFGIVLFVQSIIVIIGCFLAIQTVYEYNSAGQFIWSFRNIINLLFFVALLVYSFYAYRKDENYFKWVLYLYAILVIVSLVSSIFAGFWITIAVRIIELILIAYLIFNLSNYSKGKITVLLLVVIQVITLSWVFLNGLSPVGWLSITNLIPVVSIALTYFARYNDKGFKILL